MATLDGLAAVSRMRGWSTYPSGMCLEAVAVAYGNPHSIGPHAGDFAYALKAWNNGLNNVPNNLAGAPAGAPGFLSPGGNGYGHVFLFAGRGLIVSTDTPSGGRVGLTTVEHLCSAWGRTFLGWQRNFIGYDLVNLGETYGGGGSAPSPSGNAAVANQQNFLNAARGEKLVTDGVVGPATKAAISRYETFLRAYGYTGAIDGIWGPGVQAAHEKYYAVWSKPASGSSLSSGSSGDAVKTLQSELNRIFPSYSKLAVDGSFGPATLGVVKEFQSRAGLAVDGIVGPATKAKLRSYGAKV